MSAMVGSLAAARDQSSDSSGVAATPASDQQQPLRRQSTTEVNRTRVQENSRRRAAQLVTASVSVVVLLAMAVLALFVVGVCLYCQGWMILLNNTARPCDQPLKWWLLGMLMAPIIQFRIGSQSSREGESGQNRQKLKRLQALIMPVGILVGVVMFRHCHTCAETNPELYQYAKVYLMFQAVVWCLTFFASCGLVSLVFWMHRNGMLESGPGPHAAARDGLINEIETVPFHPRHFLETEAASDDVESPECPICQETFVLDEPVKETPCKHYFHEACLGQWLQNGKTCPLCREDLEAAIDRKQDCNV